MFFLSKLVLSNCDNSLRQSSASFVVDSLVVESDFTTGIVLSEKEKDK
jgi:hypothetical protein